ncbi:hypothetical protein COV25_02225 [candidate division WWE3 bacterium CG10_big_fil_rev_8_21_14_0_10_35_32]|nr:MAG: hypothetical protein COV25_02225 [candidate division WWE3 bacterium CG10_big_fil_rev_8_21_14_0_10_35_32]
MNQWEKLADGETLKKVATSLKDNNIEVIVVENGEEARKRAMELLPKGAEVMTMSSLTLDTIGVAKEINESGNYNAVRPKLMNMDRKTKGLEMQKMGAAPEWAVGSVNAIIESGQILIASATGSQLSAYVYGSTHVVWIVGTQKIVKNLDLGFRRVNEYAFPLEDTRARKAYGMGSGVNKILIMNKETTPGRITVIFVKEKLGF